jgi:putative endonuclease
MIRIFTSKTQKTGEIGEDLAVVFLMKQGFLIIERNFYSRNGEVDIIAKKGRTIYFFEVKTGKQGSWFNPAENLTKHKLRKYIKAVEYYVFKKKVKDYAVQAILVRIPNKPEEGASFEIVDIT